MLVIGLKIPDLLPFEKTQIFFLLCTFYADVIDFLKCRSDVNTNTAIEMTFLGFIIKNEKAVMRRNV